MQDSVRGCAAERERTSVRETRVLATGRSRRRWSAEDKARVVRESLRPGKRVGDVAWRYGISRLHRFGELRDHPKGRLAHGRWRGSIVFVAVSAPCHRRVSGGMYVESVEGENVKDKKYLSLT